MIVQKLLTKRGGEAVHVREIETQEAQSVRSIRRDLIPSATMNAAGVPLVQLVP